MKYSRVSLLAFLLYSTPVNGAKATVIPCDRNDVAHCLSSEGCTPFSTKVGNVRTLSCIVKEGSAYIPPSMAQLDWVQVGEDIDGEAPGDCSGWSVSLSSNGETVAIGALNNDGNGGESGHVRIYGLNGSNWVKVGADIDGEAPGDASGNSVALSSNGETVAIGAYWNDGNGNNSGHVRIFRLNGSNWVKVGGDIDGKTSDSGSGWSVSLSPDGETVAIGAGPHSGDGYLRGYVRIFRFNGSNWVKVGGDILGEALGDRSGTSVSLSSDGETVAIGAYQNDGNGTDSGHVRIFRLNGSDWVKVGADIDGEAPGDYAGNSVSLSSDGETVAIGAVGNDGNGDKSGHLRIYRLDGSNWVKVGGDIDGEAPGDHSGNSVALSSDGETVAIGAPSNDENGASSGHVRIYRLDGSNWVQVGSDIDGEAPADESGNSVSLSSDGETVAIGARYNDGNGDSSGHVRIYRFNDSNWVKVGADIDGEAPADASGNSVSLSSDGETVAIGARYNDGNVYNSGHVRIYQLKAGA